MGNITIENFNEDNDDVEYLEKLHDLHNDLQILSERMKVGNLVSNWHDKKEYVVHITNFKKALNNGLVLKKGHSVIKFNQKAW